MSVAEQANATNQLLDGMKRATKCLEQLSSDGPNNYRLLYCAKRDLNDALGTFGSLANQQTYEDAGRVFVQLCNGIMICTSDPAEVESLITERDNVQRTVVEFDEWSREQLDTKIAEMRLECKTDTRLQPGVSCWLWGLTPTGLRNGTLGVLVKYMPDRERWQIEVNNLTKTGRERVAIKPENLSFYADVKECGICLDPIITDCFVTSCNHFFHGKCMKIATTDTYNATDRDGALNCPVCRDWVGMKTDLGFIKRSGIELVHGVMSHTYQKIAREINFSESAESEAAVVGQWHSVLATRVSHWDTQVERLRDLHLAKPTRDTGEALGKFMFHLLQQTYGKGDDSDAAERMGFVTGRMPAHALERALGEGRNWLISLIGVYCHFLPVMGADEHPDGIAWRCRPCPPTKPADVAGLATAMEDVTVKTEEPVDLSDADIAKTLPQPKSLQPGGAGCAPSREAALEDGRFVALKEVCDRFAAKFDVTHGSDKWWGLRAVLHKCFEDGLYAPGFISKVTTLSDDQLRSAGSGFKASERIMTLIKENPFRVKDELILLKLELDAEKLAADAEVASINSNKSGSTKKGKAKAKKAKAKKETAWFTKTKDLPDGQAEGNITIPPEVMQYAHPDLLGMETADELLLFQSILQRMPADHEHRKQIESLVDVLSKGQIKSVNDPKSNTNTGLSSMKTQMSMRLGPGPDTAAQPYQYDPTFSAVQVALNDLARKMGLVDWNNNVLKLEKVTEETPGRNGPIKVHFSMPMHVRKRVEIHMESGGM